MGPVANAFPLAAFLESLQGTGVRAMLDDYGRIALVLRTGGGWTLERLRGVLASLLCRDPAGQEDFNLRFDQFFDPALRAHGGAIDVERVLAELRKLAPQAPEEGFSGPPETRPSIPEVFRRVPARLWRLWSGIGAAILIMVLAGWYAAYVHFKPDPQPGPIRVDPTPPPLAPPPSEPETVPPTPPTKETRQRHYPHTPVIESVTDAPVPQAIGWRAAASGAGLLLLAALGYGAWLGYYRRPPTDPAPAWNEQLPQWFDPGAIGGKYPPRLAPETLDHLADALGYFQSEQSGERLDVPASVAATADQWGIPALRFQRRKRLRQVLVLEDAYAEALAWNPIAGELAAGFSRRGIPVLYGRFRGVPDRFRTPEGAEVFLEDLEDERRAYLLLVFSDGKGLRRARDRFLLEDLARWPLVAWMELREAGHWDESAAVPARAGLPVHPATAEGLLRLMGHLMTEQAAGVEPYADPHRWTGLPAMPVGVPLSLHLERLLGDALPWAQSCAMMMPPLSPALAEGLRRQFHPKVPAERLERLYAVAGTTAGGLVFSHAVLAALRRGFVERRSEEQQRAVLAFLLEAIKAAEPEKRDSPAHLAWEWRYERVRLELEPDAALERLSALAAGPLGRAIKAEMGRAVAPERTGPDVGSAAIPLRALPGTWRGLQRLLALAESCGVSRREAYPVGLGHTVAVSACGFGGVALAAAAVWLYVHTGFEALIVKVGPTDQTFAITLEQRAAEGWELVSSSLGNGGFKQQSRFRLDQLTTFSFPFSRGRDYRLSVVAQGQVVRREFHSRLEIGLDSAGSLLPCNETLPDVGLIVERCPPASDGTFEIAPWAESPDARKTGRLLSIGLEVRADAAEYPALDRLAGALLETGSVDQLYRVRPGTDGEVHLTEVFNRIEDDFWPWLDTTQLIAWSAGGERLDLGRLEPDRALTLGQGATVDWAQSLLDLLSSKTAPVTEAEVLQAVETAKAAGPGAPVLLFAGGKAVTSPPPPPPAAGTVFRDRLKDGSQGPAMIVVPAGTFRMGDSQGAPDERPVHEVALKAPFALGQFEVTVAEFRRFVESAAYRTEAERGVGCWSWSSGQLGYHEDLNWRKPGFEQDERHPVVCVSWNDARAYTEWLSEQSGRAYRLPTEAEWEYAARAGTETSYWWGDDIGRNQANCDGCGSRWDNKSTAPTGSFAANPFKIWDTAGNAREWVEDCWHGGYDGAPPDGSAWTGGWCFQRVFRGGSWLNEPGHARAANRYWLTAGTVLLNLGFRVARTL